ncbi:MAG: response regulator [Proteobacteria bacterium]|nr:response regulator [Pseudomonadota bacterium]MBU1060824.1 response regulator [Pseudomonadota bacterium]
MKKVLIVDDDESFLLSLIDGFKAYEDNFTISTANDGLEAVATLKKEKISLVLTDLKMPRMDGFELVAHLSSTYPEIPVIVMTAFGTPEMEDNLRDMGTFQYIEKPIDFDVLVEKIVKGLKGPSKGFITGVSLSSFLQLLELDKKTCTLNIQAGSKSGTIYFQSGNLVDAAYDKLRAKDAAFAIVGWKNVEIEIENACSVKESNIKESLGFILLEGSRLKDENDATEAETSGSLDSLNMEDLDMAFSAEDDSQPAMQPSKTPPSFIQSEAMATNPVLAQFIAMLSSFPEIESATISTIDGNILHQLGEPNGHLANFITYVAIAADQIRMAIGAAGRQYTLFTLTNGSKLLILCGQDVIVGIQVDAAVFPEPIADGLRPVLSRIRLSS